MLLTVSIDFRRFRISAYLAVINIQRGGQTWSLYYLYEGLFRYHLNNHFFSLVLYGSVDHMSMIGLPIQLLRHNVKSITITPAPIVTSGLKVSAKVLSFIIYLSIFPSGGLEPMLSLTR